MWHKTYQNNYMLTHRAVTMAAGIEEAVSAENHTNFFWQVSAAFFP